MAGEHYRILYYPAKGDSVPYTVAAASGEAAKAKLSRELQVPEWTLRLDCGDDTAALVEAQELAAEQAALDSMGYHLGDNG